MTLPETVVDAHHHLWHLERVSYPWLQAKGVRRFFGDPTPIQQTYDVPDFRADWGAVPVAKSVHIQVGTPLDEALTETRWLAETARTHGGRVPTALVAMADLRADDLDARLDAQAAASDRVRGIRQIVGRHPDEDRQTGSGALIDDPAFARGLERLAARGWRFDLQLIPEQLAPMAAVLGQVPALPVALCHMGSPWERSGDGFDRWRRGLAQLAALPNCMVKLSGFGMFDKHWTAESMAPVVDTVLHLFGPARTMAGSNVPVDKLAKPYEAIWTELDRLTAALSADERRQIFQTTAERFYAI